MKKYKQLTLAQRSQISALLQTKTPRKVIAAIVGVSQSTLSRELRRNLSVTNIYSAKIAHECAMIRRERIVKENRLLKPFVVREALRLLREEQYSPEQISAVLLRRGMHISIESIYKLIRADPTGELSSYCRHKMKYRRHQPHHRSSAGKSLIPNRVSIHERPREANGKRFGDWEMDLIIGSGRHDAILTLIERSTNFSILRKLPLGKNPEGVVSAVIDELFLYKKNVLTITTDNGLEFMRHDLVERALGTKVYYTDPYSSWQKGAIENANKLIRQYIPKGADFSEYGDRDILEIQKKINRRPRKKLSFECPRDIFFNSLRH